MNGDQRRWPWWVQMRDAASAIAGLAILGVETYRGTWHPIGVTAALVCLGIVGAGALERYIGRRIESNGK